MTRLDLLVAPEKTGIYLFKDRRGGVLYVGKAKNLRARLKAYLRPESDSRHRIVYLMQEAEDFEFFVTANEREAFLLENNLIKKHRPPYNVYFRDDKDYLCVRLHLGEPFPRFRLVRRVAKDGALYFGPYSSAKKIRYLLGVAGKLFPMRTCTDSCFISRKKPCMQYQIKRCPAPCVGLIGREEYMRNVHEALKILRGDFKGIQKELRREMKEHSRMLLFEMAAEVRDKIQAIHDLSETQSVVNAALPDADIFGLFRENDRGAVAIVLLRNCKVIDVRCFLVNARGYQDGELLSSVLSQFYGEGSYLPEEIVSPFKPDDTNQGIAVTLRLGNDVKIKVPQRGKRKELLKFAAENAREFFEARKKRELQYDELMEQMMAKLHLVRRPVRVECFDISHHGGKHPVGSLVVFEYGIPLKDNYRKFRVKDVQGIDDYLMISEIIGRRLKRGKTFGGLPDLMIIDGGKGHLFTALKIVRPVSEDVDIISIAKGTEKIPGGKDDSVYLPGRKNPLMLKSNDPVLLFIKRVRDEAHRFAISYHKVKDEKEKIRSFMLNFPGIGRLRTEKLITTFGSPKGVLERSPREIASLLRISPGRAKEFLTYLRNEFPK